ncbi:MAG: helix-turn-helix domain-containing protein [Pseudomonadota bacterium]
MNASSKTIRIGILIFPDCAPASAVAVVEVFNAANALLQFRPASEHMRFETQWLSVGGGVVSVEGGLTFPTGALADGGYEVLMVPGIVHRNATELPMVLARLAPERAALQRYAGSHGMVASNCSGTFLLAEAGLLDGRRATTSWWLSKLFHKRYPTVIIDTEELLILDGPILSSGAVTAYIDMGLWLIGHFASESLRQMTAKILAADSHRSSQSPYISAAMVQGDGHAVVERARRWLNQHMDQEWNMAELAEYCHTSPRTLLRRFQKAVGMSPVQYTQQLRVERAKGLLESSMLSLEDITERCGYANVSTFSTVFKRWAQVTPREYRSRFGLRT